jgi:flavodoxin II
MNIGLFYGSTTCYTEMVAEKIQAIVNNNVSEYKEYTLDIFNIKDTSLSTCKAYDFVIFGISTWDYGELQEDWESHWSDVAKLDLDAKLVALYGMGDQVGYADWFQDALGMLHEQLAPTGAYVIGQWPNEGYVFNESKALTPDKSHFVGLSLDDETQYELTDSRIEQWLAQLINEINTLLIT